jgi:hypothetical protein
MIERDEIALTAVDCHLHKSICVSHYSTPGRRRRSRVPVQRLEAQVSRSLAACGTQRVRSRWHSLGEHRGRSVTGPVFSPWPLVAVRVERDRR